MAKCHYFVKERGKTACHLDPAKKKGWARWTTTAEWERVTCRRCLRRKKDIDQFRMKGTFMLTHYLSKSTTDQIALIRITACGIDTQEPKERFMVTNMWVACDCPACLDHKPSSELGPLNPPDPELEQTLDELEALEPPEPEGILDGLADAVEELEHEEELENSEAPVKEQPEQEFHSYGDTVHSPSAAHPDWPAMPTKTEDPVNPPIEWAMPDFTADDLSRPTMPPLEWTTGFEVPDTPEDPARTPYMGPKTDVPPVPEPEEPAMMQAINPTDGHVFLFTLDTIPDFEVLIQGDLLPGWSIYECSCGGYVKAADLLIHRVNGMPCPHCKNGFIWWLKGYVEMTEEMLAEDRWDGLVHYKPQGKMVVTCGAKMDVSAAHLVSSDTLKQVNCAACLAREFRMRVEETKEYIIRARDPVESKSWPRPVPSWTGAERYKGTVKTDGPAIRLMQNAEALIERIPNVQVSECPHGDNAVIFRAIWTMEKAIAYLDWLDDWIDAMHYQFLAVT